jgi:ATP-dependent Clp protease protease subunit
MEQQMNSIPVVIEQNESNKQAIDVFSRLLKERVIFLTGEINDKSANLIVAQLLHLAYDSPEKDIHFYINSPGGSVSAALAIFDTMRFIGPDIATICTGLAASGGALLLAAGTKGKRYAMPNARVMIHQPLGGAQGDVTNIQIQAKEILKTKHRLNEMLADFTGQNLKEIEKATDRDKWFSAPESKDFGLVDDVIESMKTVRD